MNLFKCALRNIQPICSNVRCVTLRATKLVHIMHDFRGDQRVKNILEKWGSTLYYNTLNANLKKHGVFDKVLAEHKDLETSSSKVAKKRSSSDLDDPSNDASESIVEGKSYIVCAYGKRRGSQ